jgi:hypothetical protein
MTSGFDPRSTARPVRPWVLLAIVAAVGVVVVFSFGSWSPVSRSGQVTTAEVGCLCGYKVVPLPGNENVTVRWADGSGGTVRFEIVPPGVGPASFACHEVGASGVCALYSVAGNYTFNAFDYVAEPPQIVNFTATYYVSLL